MRKILVFLVIFVIPINSLIAQQDIYKHKVSGSFGFGFDNVQYENFRFSDNFVSEINYQRVLNSTFSLEVSLPYYFFSVFDTQSEMFIPSVNLIINTDNGYLFYERAKWSPYLRIGTGVVTPDSENNTWEDYSLNLGIGLKYRMGDKWNLFIESNYLGLYSYTNPINFNTLYNPNRILNLKAGVSFNFGEKHKDFTSTNFYHNRYSSDSTSYVKHQKTNDFKGDTATHTILNDSITNEFISDPTTNMLIDTTAAGSFNDSIQNQYVGSENKVQDSTKYMIQKSKFFKGTINVSDADTAIQIDILLNDTIQINIEKTLFAEKSTVIDKQTKLYNSALDSSNSIKLYVLNNRIDSLNRVISNLTFKKDTVVVLKNTHSSDTVYLITDTFGEKTLYTVKDNNDNIEQKFDLRIAKLEQQLLQKDSLLVAQDSLIANAGVDSVMTDYENRLKALESIQTKQITTHGKNLVRDTIIVVNKIDFPDNSNLLNEIKKLQSQINNLSDTISVVKQESLYNEEKSIILTYSSGSYTLMPDHIRKINLLLDFIEKNPKMKIYISGFSDKKGNPEFNLVLSKKRAQAVKNYLINYGTNADKIVLMFFGESKAISERDLSERRVEVKVK